MRSLPPLALLVVASPSPERFRSSRPVALHVAAGRTLLDRVLETALAAAASEPGAHVVLAGPAEVLESARGRAPALRTLLVEGPSPAAAGAAGAAGAAEVLDAVDAMDAEEALDAVESLQTLASSAFGGDLAGLRLLVLRAETPLLSTGSVLAAAPVSPGLAVASGELVPAGEALRVTTRRELAAVEAVLRARAVGRAMDAGATLVRPETVTLDDTVELEADCVVGPYATLCGATSVGSGSRIGQGCVLVDARIGCNVDVRPYCVVEKAVVGDGAVVGPFARLREGTELGPEVHVGNFVETKKARLARGAKANHLTYLGDADVGEGTNVGAGVITCNYDGVFKHRTTIGAKAFIGSDVQLVAPVTVGDGALVAAGTTVTEDVPPGDLALSRTPQRNLAGQGKAYVARKRAEKARKEAG